MSEFSLNIRHEQRLWTMREKGADLKLYSHDLPNLDA